MGHAYVFPGQGSQTPGMGKELADAFSAAREVFEEVDDALGRSLSKLMWSDDVDAINLTINAQPALMAHSIAAFRVLEKEANTEVAKASFVAGHSLGEYSALCAAGALSIADTAKMLHARGKAMQAATPAGQGGMAALLGITIEAAEAAIKATPGEGILEVANDNAPGQVVVSGDLDRIKSLVESARSHKIKMVKILPVSAAFHSSMMAPAADAMRPILEEASFSPFEVPVVDNVTARPTSRPEEIRTLLVDQITERVRWTDSVSYMVEQGVSRFFEIGTGKILSGLIRRIAKETETVNFGVPDDIDAFIKTYA